MWQDLPLIIYNFLLIFRIIRSACLTLHLQVDSMRGLKQKQSLKKYWSFE